MLSFGLRADYYLRPNDQVVIVGKELDGLGIETICNCYSCWSGVRSDLSYLPILFQIENRWPLPASACRTAASLVPTDPFVELAAGLVGWLPKPPARS